MPTSYTIYGFAQYTNTGTFTWTLLSGPDPSAVTVEFVDANTNNEIDPGEVLTTLSNVSYRGFYTGGNGEKFAVLYNSATTQYLLHDVDGIYTPGNFPASLNILAIDPVQFCSAAGTLIETPRGAQVVEALEIGDLIHTADGRAVPVIWVGRQTVHKAFVGEAMQLVRIRQGAMGGGLPHSDLVVTADHGMVFPSSSEAVGAQDAGYVINASALVNGDTIDWVPMDELDDRFTVNHIETEAHDVILANGAPAETFVDVAGRRAFDNYGEYLELYGPERIIPEMDRPRIASQRLLPEAIKARLGIAEPQIDWDTPLSA